MFTAPVLAAAVSATPAHARSAAVHFGYLQPHVTTNNTDIVWSWNITNGGPDVADQMTVTHTVSDGQRVAAVSPPCTATGHTVTCSLGRIRPGESRSGTITTNVLPGQVRIDGTATWFETPISSGMRRAVLVPETSGDSAAVTTRR